MELDGVMLNVISAYAPQVRCIREEKETFWLDLDETVEKIPRNERIVVGADLNGHVGERKPTKSAKRCQKVVFLYLHPVKVVSTEL